MRYAIIGTGAVGGYYGAKLQQTGCDIHFLLRSDYDHVHRHGLRLLSPDGDIRLPEVNAYERVEDMPACDVVLVTLKTTQNTFLADILPHVTAPGSLVVLMQNGLGQEQRVQSMVPECRVAAGLCFICATKTAPGEVRHQDYGRVQLAGPLQGPDAGLLARVAEDLGRSGIDASVTSDLLTARWHKLVWNVPFNGLTVVLRANTGELVTNPETRTLARALMDEVIAGAKACGAHVENTSAEQMMRDTDTMTPYEPSMLIDFRQGREMEVEAIFGEPVRAAQKHGCTLPRVETLYHQLAFLNSSPSPLKAL